MATETYAEASSAADVTSFSIQCTAEESGYISTIGLARGDGSTTSSFLVEIEQSGTLASVAGNITSTANPEQIALALEDYSPIISAGEFTIQITRQSGDIKCQSKTDTFNGTLFDFTSQAVPVSGLGSDPNITFTTAAAPGTNIQINKDDVFKEVSDIKINVDDVWKEVTAAKINKDDSWKEVF